VCKDTILPLFKEEISKGFRAFFTKKQMFQKLENQLFKKIFRGKSAFAEKNSPAPVCRAGAETFIHKKSCQNLVIFTVRFAPSGKRICAK
jgi:hypothetical protein